MKFSKIKFDEDAAQEVKDRLWQTEYAIAKHNQCIQKYKSATESDAQDINKYIRSNINVNNELFNNGKFYAESYYYFAFRIYKILTHKNKSLPFLENFSCPGVLMIRNHLIEHPEGASSNATKYSYSFSYEHGALLRTANDSNQKVRDRGIFFNSTEFRENFIKTVKNSYEEIYKLNPNPILRPVAPPSSM